MGGFLRVVAASVFAARVALGQDEHVERLKALVDARLEELRAELHRAIDDAFPAAAPRLELSAPSEEFRALHRLDPALGARIVSGAGTEGDGLRDGDTVLRIGSTPVSQRTDITARVSAAARSGAVVAEVVRKGTRMLVLAAPGPAVSTARAAPESRQAETADEMLDRLWKKAVIELAPTGAESIPEKKPIPQEGPRR